MSDLATIERKLGNLQRSFNELMQMFEAKASTVIQSKWVYKSVAMEITGLCERSLMDETVLRGGTINVNKAGKSYRFLRTDCEKYVMRNSTLQHGIMDDHYSNKLKKTA